MVCNNVPVDLECPICLSLWRDPVVISPCEHIINRECWDSLPDKSHCPVCRTQVSGPLGTPHRILLTQMNSTQVTCSVPGCTWKGRAESFEAHVCTMDQGDKQDQSSVQSGSSSQQPAADVDEVDTVGVGGGWNPPMHAPGAMQMSPSPARINNTGTQSAAAVISSNNGRMSSSSNDDVPFASFEINRGRWGHLDQQSSRALRAAHAEGTPVIDLIAGEFGNTYTFDLIAMVQTNTLTKTRRCISLDPDGDGEHDDFAVQFQSGSETQPSWTTLERSIARLVEAASRFNTTVTVASSPHGAQYLYDPVNGKQTNTISRRSRALRIIPWDQQ